MDGRHRRALIVSGLTAAVAVVVAVSWPARAPAAAPQAPAVPAPTAASAAAFFTSYRERPPAARDALALKELVDQFANAVNEQVAVPAAGPTFDEAEPELRRALEALPPDEFAAQYGSYFEYHAARRAQQDGNAKVMRAAVEHLDAFTQRCPHESYLAIDRALIAADIRRYLGDLAGALAAIARVEVPATAAADVCSYRACVHAEVLRDLGRLDAAMEQVKEARRLAFASGNSDSISAALLCEQSLALATGRFDDSIEAMQTQLAAIGTAPSPVRSLLLVLLGYAESGRAGMDRAGIDRALAALDIARPECDDTQRLRVDIKRFDLALRRGHFELAEDIRRSCESRIGAAVSGHEMTRDGEEFWTLCARLALARGADCRDDELAAARQSQRAVLASIGSEWARQPAQRSGIGFLQHSRRREALAAGIGLELAVATREGRADGPEQAMQLVVDLHARTSLARAREAGACSVNDIQAQLPRGGAVLAVVSTREISYLFLVEAAAVHWGTVAGNVADDDHVRELMAVLAQPPGSRDEAAAKAIAEEGRAAFRRCIPEGLREAVQRAEALTIVGSDMCGGLPFEVLVRDDGKLLGEVAAIDNCPSLPLAVAIAKLSKPVKASDARVLFVGCSAPKAESDVDRFQEPEAEIAACLKPFPMANVHRLMKEDATRARFAAESLKDYALVHLLLHRVPDPASSGGALLFDDGACGQAELRDRNCRGVVVVSSCGAGLGPSRVGEGEGFHSFVGTFLWNGASAVIASQRDLLVLPHLLTMAEFQRHLAAGDSPARAMQKARAALAEGSDLVARAHRAMVQVFGAGQVAIF